VHISIETLLTIWEVEVHNVSDRTSFNRLNIVYIREFETGSVGDGNELYFVVYEDNPKEEGWYTNAFDRAKNIPKLRQRSDIVFVVDGRVSDSDMHGLKYLRVPDVFLAIDQLREHVLSTTNPMVVGVTGSVGKTTTTAMIQSILSGQFECGRIYSKRLTPLNLSSWIVNYLDPSHQVLCLEYSMYRPHHIEALTRILKPRVGVMLNIKRVHLGVFGINTLLDIREAKRSLVEKAETAVLNVDDPLVVSLKRRGDLTFSFTDHCADAFLESDGEEALIRLNFTNQSIRFRPYVRTDLFYYQSLASALTASFLGVPAEAISGALNQFRPAENRIRWIAVRGETFLFDGDATYAGRLSALAENRYSTSILLIVEFNFGEENVSLQAEDLSGVFGQFSEVRVLDSQVNQEALSRYRIRNCSLVSKEQFLHGVSSFEFKVIHFGIYFRRYKDLGHLTTFLGA